MAVSSTSFKPGSSFWKNRSKHGRDAIFTDPTLFKTQCISYFDFVDANPWMKKEAVKSGDKAGMIIDIPTQRPYNQWELCNFLGVSPAWWNNFQNSQVYNNNKENWDEAFGFVDSIMKGLKYTGAAVGAFNPSLIMRDLGIREMPKAPEPPAAGDPQNLPPSQTIIYLPAKGSTEPEELDDI